MRIEHVTEQERQLERHADRADLQVAILAVQLTIEKTDEDDTRIRMKSALTALQRMAKRIEVRKAE